MIGGSCNGDSSLVIQNDSIRGNEKLIAQSVVDYSMVYKDILPFASYRVKT